MPQVVAKPRKMQDGSEVTQFVDSTSSEAVMYTYPTKQSELRIENSGQEGLYISVGSHRNIFIARDTVWNVTVEFDSFSIYSNVPSQEFIATATYKPITNINQVSSNSPMPIKVEDSSVALPVEIRSLNKTFLFTTVSNLGANAVFTSPTYDANSFRWLNSIIDTNQDGTLYVQQSLDQNTWYITSKVDVKASTSVSISSVTHYTVTNSIASIYGPYVRLVYVNGATATTRFNFSANSVSN